MNRSYLVLLGGLLLGHAPTALHAQIRTATAWDSVGQILQTPAAATGDYHRFSLPRRDVTLRVGDVTVSPALALGAWAGFSGQPADATVMGDLVLTAAELGPVLAELANGDIDVTAIHNHLAGAEPQITYVHFYARGVAVELARRLDHAIALTATPRPVAAASRQSVTIDTATVFRALGLSGRAQGSVAQVSTILVPRTVSLHGRTVTPTLGYGSPLNIQAVGGGRVVATGDVALLEQQVDPVLDAFAEHGITPTALHNHLIGESPTIYYIHFWADGPLDAVLRGLRAALDAARGG